MGIEDLEREAATDWSGVARKEEIPWQTIPRV
jgi:hypothetical protein